MLKKQTCFTRPQCVTVGKIRETNVSVIVTFRKSKKKLTSATAEVKILRSIRNEASIHDGQDIHFMEFLSENQKQIFSFLRES